MRAKIRSFIESNLNVFDEAADFSDEDNIFEKGFVDSMFSLQLVTFVENEFSVQVGNEDLELSNFSSINNLVAFLERKIGGGGDGRS